MSDTSGRSLRNLPRRLIGLRGGSLRPQNSKDKFILGLLKQLNEGASLKVKAPGFEISAGGVVAILAAFVLVLLLLG